MIGLYDELTRALIYPANDNSGSLRNPLPRIGINARVHPARLRVQAQLRFILWRAPGMKQRAADASNFP
jgi:hypothetical protein